MGFLTRSFEGREATDVRVSATAVGTAGRGGLGKLSIRGTHRTRGLTDIGLSSVGRCCPSLNVLSLWKVPRVSDEGLAEIANGCPMLEKLDLCDCPLITSKGLLVVAEKCPNLMSLQLDSCTGIGDECLQNIGRYCPNLQSVSIKDCPLVGDEGIAGMMCSTSSSLAKLRLEKLNVGDFALACIGHYGRSIMELHLTGLQNVAERGFWCLGNAKGLLKLRSIVTTSCRGVTDRGLEAVAKGCPNLNQLSIHKCCFISDNGLKRFIEASRELEKLQLEECHRITLVGVLAVLVKCNAKLRKLALVRCLGIRDIQYYPDVLPLCKSLQSIRIRDCPGFTSMSLALVGKICPSLRRLDISGLVTVTDAGLLPVIQSSENGLIKVKLRGCANLTDTSICALVKEHGDTLRLLNFDGCNKITDKVLLTISEQCTMLEELYMSNADVTDYGVALLASARQLNLYALSFSGCSKVTTRSLPFFGNMGRTLVGLNLQHCALIQAHGVSLLEERMWWCDILS
ncbi:EIN3-binding F-box protein 1-like [Asparagus officinalis]|nr:EIN3-binding F-box protein 1-like [Asparagus officinalis]